MLFDNIMSLLANDEATVSGYTPYGVRGYLMEGALRPGRAGPMTA